jgi:uncharacterized protein
MDASRVPRDAAVRKTARTSSGSGAVGSARPGTRTIYNGTSYESTRRRLEVRVGQGRYASDQTADRLACEDASILCGLGCRLVEVAATRRGPVTPERARGSAVRRYNRAVAPRIALDRNRLVAFCRRYHIRELALFGSVLREDFRPDSDVDVLVEFEPGHTPGLAFFRIERELSELVGRTVDLNTPHDLSRHFRDEVRREAEVLYAA